MKCISSKFANNPLTKVQKEAITLLSAGTFLEYFDLMLYVHMAVVLDKLFFQTFSKNTTNYLKKVISKI